MGNILRQICEKKLEHIALCKSITPETLLRQRVEKMEKPKGFAAALRQQVEEGKIGLIAEIKKASPSKGVIRLPFDPPELADAYAKGGATCLSVLTDEPFFQGHNHHLRAARMACPLPILRKDFMLDPYQVIEARAIGADCILLIMAALEDSQACELEAAAAEVGLDVLAEVHDEAELDRALGALSTRLIGINNRDLKTLEIDLQTSISLRSRIPDGYLVVAESGIRDHADIRRLQEHDIHCFLVGESLMLQRNIARATRRLLGTDS